MRKSFGDKGYVTYETEQLHFCCGYEVLGHVMAFPAITCTKEDLLADFIDWMFHSTDSPLISDSWDEDDEEGVGPRWCCSRVLFADALESPCDTKLLAKVAGVDDPSVPWARNPNTGNYVKHWYVDLQDDLKEKAL